MPKNPLANDHYEKLCKLGDACVQTREYLQKCKRCNIDVEREIRDNDEQLAVVEAIKKEFFPHRS